MVIRATGAAGIVIMTVIMTADTAAVMAMVTAKASTTEYASREQQKSGLRAAFLFALLLTAYLLPPPPAEPPLVALPEPDAPVLPDELPLDASLAPPDALGEDDPEDLAFLAFLDFVLAFGLVSVVASAAPAADEPEVAAGEPLPIEELPVALGEFDEPELVPIEPDEPLLGDDPDAPVPLEPEAPDVLSPAPEELDPGLALEPEEPELDAPGIGVLDGTELEVPLPPDMPASLPVPAPVAPVALCDFVVDDGSVALLPDCASAMDDTDATTISDSERRVVFNVMSNSFGLEKWHHLCSSLDATPARLFSGVHAAGR